MKKPIIKNWIRYWASTLAISGMLVMGACGDSNETAENEVETVETEVAAPAREDVAAVETDVAEEEPVAAETEDVANVVTAASDFPSTYIDDMDAFIEEHEEVNNQIRETLIDNNTNLDAGSTPDAYQDQDQQPLNNTDQTQQENSLENNTEQDTANVYDRQSNTNFQEGPDAYLMILEERRNDYDAENQQAMDDIMNEYNERRESMRGQMDETTGAYASPEVDPQYQEGIKQLMENIQENLVYPQNAAAAEIEGTVFVNFIVDENGNITEANAVEDVIVPTTSMQYTQPLNPTKFSEQEIEETKKEMKEEAIKAVKATSGQWEAAKQDGQNVKAEVQLPVVFDIENIAAPEDVPLQE